MVVSWVSNPQWWPPLPGQRQSLAQAQRIWLEPPTINLTSKTAFLEKNYRRAMGQSHPPSVSRRYRNHGVFFTFMTVLYTLGKGPQKHRLTCLTAVTQMLYSHRVWYLLVWFRYNALQGDRGQGWKITRGGKWGQCTFTNFIINETVKLFCLIYPYHSFTSLTFPLDVAFYFRVTLQSFSSQGTIIADVLCVGIWEAELTKQFLWLHWRRVRVGRPLSRQAHGLWPWGEARVWRLLSPNGYGHGSRMDGWLIGRPMALLGTWMEV